MCVCVCTCVYVLCRHMHATECTWWWEDDVWCHHVSGRAPCSLPQTSWPKASDCPLLCFYFHLTKAVGTVAVCCYICLHPDSGIYSSLWCYTESALPAEPSPGLRSRCYVALPAESSPGLGSMCCAASVLATEPSPGPVCLFTWVKCWTPNNSLNVTQPVIWSPGAHTVSLVSLYLSQFFQHSQGFSESFRIFPIIEQFVIRRQESCLVGIVWLPKGPSRKDVLQS